MSNKKSSEGLFWYLLPAIIAAIIGSIYVFSQSSSPKEYQSHNETNQNSKTLEKENDCYACPITDKDQIEKLRRAYDWEAYVDLIAYQDLPNTNLLMYKLYDRKEQPIENAVITVFISRSSEEDPIDMIKLNEADPGLYVTPIEFPEDGDWYFRIMALKENRYLQLEKSLTVQTPMDFAQ